MKIENAPRPLTCRVGNKSYPVPKQNLAAAGRYDGNGNGAVTLEEIKDTLRGHLPEGMTVDLRDYAVGIRQNMLGLRSPHVDSYPDSAEIDKSLERLAKAHPGNAEVVTIGKSSEGRDIKALHVSRNVGDAETSSKPSVIVTGNLHAREWATNGAVTSAAEKFLNGAAAEAMENLEVWFVPNTNPDGYQHSRNVDPMWRKNTSRDEHGHTIGVDLNRNFPYSYRQPGDTPKSHSDDVGASDDPEQLTYRGKSPLSEDESQVVKSLLDQEKDAVGLLDIHGFGRMLLVCEGDFGVSRKEYDSIAGSMNKAIKNIDYTVMSDKDLYPTTGGLSTYADSLGLVGITMEMGTSFHPRPQLAGKAIDGAADGIVEFVRQMEERVSVGLT